MKWLTSWWTVGALLVATTLAHMLTGTEHMAHHNVFRRLYYLPIILGAFRGGRRGGGLTALAAVAMYAPHAFFMQHHMDPAPMPDKILEVLLFVLVGLLTGLLVERERKAVRARRTAEERAARFESIATLTRGLAHEVRNPLAAIRGSLEVVQPDYDGHRKERIVTIGLQETERLERVVNDFMAFARPAEPTLSPMDLGAVARAVADATRLAHPGIAVTVEAPEVIVAGDADQLRQVVLNLALNAAHWSEGRVAIRVGNGEHPSIAVEDDGPGVAPADRERIFDPYFTQRADGTGLGLSTAARIARAHGATLTCEEALSGGARLVMRFGGPHE